MQLQRNLVQPSMIRAPASHLVRAFLILFLTRLCPIAIMVPLVLLQCFSWVTQIHRVEIESQSQKPVPSSMVMTPMPLSHPPALLQGEISEQQSEEERVSVEERSYLRRKKKCNLLLPVSMFLSLLYIFQTHSPVPRKYSRSTVIHRTTPRGPEIISLCEPVSLTQREWRMAKGRQKFKYPLL